MRRALLLLAIAAWLGCDDPAAGPRPPAPDEDAGVASDAGPGDDAGPATDAGPGEPTPPSCGDGVVQPALGEGCDDGVNDGAPGRCDPTCAFLTDDVVFSEVMYNPVKQDDFVERHEFIELANLTPVEVNLAGWRVEGVELVFPADARLPAGGRLVVAKDRGALESVYGPMTVPVVDGYPGTLDNGGETLELLRADGSRADLLDYDDDRPWARGADAFGADERWLADVDDLEPHRFRGRSLERVNLEVSAARIENWVASPLPVGPTPGAPGEVAREVPLDIALRAEVVAADGPGPIRPGSALRLEVQMSDSGPLQDLVVELFVDELGVDGEGVQTLPLVDLGARRYEADLPTPAARDLVRWRLVGDRGAGPEVIEPRAGDPEPWRVYFAQPDPGPHSTRTYELLIAPDDWTALFDNVQGGRVNGCGVSPTWQLTRPAVFIHDGRVVDVQVRYQGSRYNRTNGARIDDWTAPGPARPSPLRALSWKIDFPGYARLDNERSAIILNKLQQACSGLYQGVGFALFRDAGLDAPDARYARLFINGAYYNYALELDHVSEQVFERFHAEVGHLFKAKGNHFGEEGPWDKADGRLFDEGSCGYTLEERYAFNYDRKTHGWDGHDELMSLIEDLHVAREAGTDALRAHLAERWDVDYMLTYFAVMQWLAPWDDNFHNYYLYQRREDGRWTLAPWDLDLVFGDRYGGRADLSLYVGTFGDPDTSGPQSSFFKDSFLTAYPDEYEARLLELTAGLLSPVELQARIDAWRTTAEVEDAQTSAAGVQCNFDQQAQRTRDWVQARHDFVVGELAP